MGALALLFMAVWGAGAAEPLAWPLDLPKELTSSFGEYRPGRFHAGIDLRTGDIGKEVHAAGDGYVSRVRCSPYGYGKAVYLTLDDGTTVVYGHLSDYREDLRAYVRAAQHAAKNYTVDLSPKPGEFRVKRREVVALSGDTGIGVPHLHWEIRDKSGRLVNPRLLGIMWPDAVAPIAENLLVWPEGGTVNGDVTPQVVPLKAAGPGRYTAGTIAVAGPVALGVDVVDPEKGGAKLGIHEGVLRVDSEEVFTVRNDYLDYEHNESGAVAFCTAMADRGRFLTLWRYPGNDAASYAITKGDGVLPASTTRRRAEIVLDDFNGNRASIDFDLAPDSGAPISPPQPGVKGSGAFSLEAYGDSLVLTARFDQAEPEAPSGEYSVAVATAPLDFVRVGQRTFRALLRPEQAGSLRLKASHPRAEAFVADVAVAKPGASATELRDGEFMVRAAGDAAYGTLFLSATRIPEPPADPIRRAGPCWSVGPANQPLKGTVEVSLPIPADVQVKRAAIYRSSGGGWTRLDTKVQGEHYVAASSRLGLFAVLEDLAAPVIGSLVPGEKEATPSRRPALRAKISDIGSGIASYAIYCGKQWLLAAYDPEQNLIRWEQDEELPSGTQEIVFEATDAAGNVSRTTRTITVP